MGIIETPERMVEWTKPVAVNDVIQIDPASDWPGSVGVFRRVVRVFENGSVGVHVSEVEIMDGVDYSTGMARISKGAFCRIGSARWVRL